MSRIITRVSTDTGGDETINNITELDTTITESNSSSEGAGVSSYNDLTDKPVLFDGDYDSLTDQPDLKTINGESILGSGDLVVLTGATVVDAEPAQGSTNVAQSGGVFNALDLKVDKENLTSLYNTTSDLSSTIINKTIATTGDYLEIRAKGLSTSANIDLTYLVSPNASFQRFAFLDSNTFQLRMSTTKQYDVTGVVPNDWNVYKLVKTSIGYELFLNGISKGDIANADTFTAYTIGANTSISGSGKWEIDYVETKVGGSIEKFENLYRNENSTNVSSNDTLSYDLRKIYIKKQLSVSSLVTERIDVYVQMSGVQYQHYIIDHEVDTSDSIYVNYWRLAGGWLSEKLKDTFTDSYLILDTFENEQTMQEIGKSDATGGVHGDERIDLESGDGVVFLANNLPISLADIPENTFLGLDEFAYIANSHLYETDNVLHPLVATHSKRTSFSDSGFSTQNVIKLLAEMNLFVYTALFCIAKTTATFVANEDNKYTGTTSSGADLLVTENPSLRNYYGYNPTTGLSSFASSKIIDLTDDFESKYRISDRVDDSKYYRTSKTDTHSIGKEFRSEGFVKFFKNN